MLFMYIHTHPLEKCIADKPEEAKKMLAGAQEATKKAGIKMTGPYVAPTEHTTYAIFETDDVAKLDRMLVPMTVWGTARLVPIVPIEQLIAMG